MKKAKNYNDLVKPNLDKIREWAAETTDTEIAARLGVSQPSFSQYKQQHEELKDALIKGRQNLVGELRNTLIKRAKGFHEVEEKTITEALKMSDDMKEAMIEAGFSEEQLSEIKVVRTETKNKYYPPDVAALNLCLKNYDMDDWANDPQTLKLREKELELRKEKMEADNW